MGDGQASRARRHTRHRGGRRLLAVARNRFVAPGFANELWGVPLDYGGQILLALSAAPALAPGLALALSGA